LIQEIQFKQKIT